MNTPRTSTPKPPRSYRVMQVVMGPLLRVLGMSCREILQLSAARLDRKLTLREKVKLRMHTMMCALCRPLPRQFTNLRELIRCAHQHETSVPDGRSPLSLETHTKITAALKNEQSKR